MDFAPLFVGKLSTACQIGYVALALVVLSAGVDWPLVMRAAAIATAAATLVSWLGYGRVLRAAMRARSRNRA